MIDLSKEFEGNYEREKGNLRIFDMGQSEMVVVFFKDSKIQYYQEHIEMLTSKSFAKYKIGQKGWSIQDV